MRLLICDDDISTVDVIERQLAETDLGLTGVLRAYNGEAAKEIIEKERPELILCDIGMPRCNGIEVLKFIHESKIDSEFCFLTCYEDFEYAKTALRYGAKNYITKPFEFEELKVALQQMIASARQKSSAPGMDAQEQHDSVLNNVLRQISDGIYGANVHTINSLLERNGLPHKADDTWHLVVSCTDMTDAIKGVWSRELLMYTIGRFHDEALADYVGSAYTLVNTDDRFIWCFCFVPDEVCADAALEERCTTLMALCGDHMSLHPVILISEPFALYEAGAVKSRIQTKMRSIRFYAGKICHINDADEILNQTTTFLDAPQIHWYLKKHDSVGFHEYVSAVTNNLANSGDYSRQVMDNLRREMINTFISSLRDNNLPAGMIFEDSEINAMNDHAAKSLENLRQFASRLFEITNAALQGLADSDDIINRVEAYIREHFRENINRDDVAAIAYITPNYLSKQFRSKKGMNLREYINQIRIDEAKRLLLTTNLSVSEVAGLSGYENISYFSTVFRKQTGMSPVDWRNSENGNGENHDN